MNTHPDNAWDNKEYRNRYRHTGSHVLAHAVKNLYPEVKLAIGPAIENGFYYDFDKPTPFTTDDLKKIEEEMKRIIRQKLDITRFEMDRFSALEWMSKKEEPYKIQLIQEFPDDQRISFYSQGDFTDLCAGPHMENTGDIQAIKLIQTAGAYWKGNEKNKMLHRIYGTCFPDKQMMVDYLQALEEAKKRDHNKLGRELGYFTTSEVIGQGLPVILPKGAKVIQIIQRFVEDEEERRGYQLTRTPLLAKSDLYKISGHWDHYREGMFVIGDEEKDDEVFALRPMTCPFQFQAYLLKTRSYRDLPIRYNETSTLFRNESSGEMHGLIRVRQFTISEGHIVCRPDQLKSEFADALQLAIDMLKALGLIDDIQYRYSKWDKNDKKKYIGDEDAWENAQNLMKSILDEMSIDYVEADGEAAFYGPKLDFQIRNVHGKEDTLITIQVDFQLAQRFEMEYIDADSSKKSPLIIHRTSIGCYERTLALLIEKYAGAMPIWLAPVQVGILPVSRAHVDFADQLLTRFQVSKIRAVVDSSDEKLGKKIRNTQMEKIPYMLIVGDKEIENQTVSVRSHKKGDLGTMNIDDFVRIVFEENEKKLV
jgi:threonyl-tRNA synthetase